MRKLCQNTAGAGVASTPSNVFNNVSIENTSIAGNVALPNIKKSIYREKKTSVNPGIKTEYKSIKTFAEHLQAFPELLTYKEKDEAFSFSADLIISSSKTHHLIFYDQHLLEEFQNQNDIFVDATFDIIPNVKGVKQILTVMSKKSNIVVPCAWILMSRRTTKAYNAVWKYLNTNFPNFRPQRAMCDYEKALMKSLTVSFEGTKVRGCYFHFTQALVRKAKSKEYQLFLRKENKEKNPIGNEILKKLLTLPLLPADRVEEGLQIICNLIDSKLANDAKTLKKWRKFVNIYFTKFWMKEVTPNVFSVYNMNDRTNNYVESYHRTLNQMIRKKPNTYVFIYSLIKIKEKAKLDLQRAHKKLKPTDGAKEKTILRDLTIRDAWMELQSSPPWTIEKFLNELSGYDDNMLEKADVNNDTIEKIGSEISDSDDEDPDVDFQDFKYGSSEEQLVADKHEELNLDENVQIEKCKIEENSRKEEPKEQKAAKKQSERKAKQQKKASMKRKTAEAENTESKKTRGITRKRVIKKKLDENYEYF